jgi:hypothetical protein
MPRLFPDIYDRLCRAPLTAKMPASAPGGRNGLYQAGSRIAASIPGRLAEQVVTGIQMKAAARYFGQQQIYEVRLQF